MNMHDHAIADTRRWLERAVIGLNLCPFAKAPHIKGQIHYAVCAGGGRRELLALLRAELLALAALEASERETTLLILSTAPGERPMRPDFGCAIHQFMFAPVDATTEGRIAQEVERALERWEPRIDLVDIVVERAPDEDATLYIDITYSVRGSNDPRNLVFPFYVIPTD